MLDVSTIFIILRILEEYCEWVYNIDLCIVCIGTSNAFKNTG